MQDSQRIQTDLNTMDQQANSQAQKIQSIQQQYDNENQRLQSIKAQLDQESKRLNDMRTQRDRKEGEIKNALKSEADEMKRQADALMQRAA